MRLIGKCDFKTKKVGLRRQGRDDGKQCQLERSHFIFFSCPFFSSEVFVLPSFLTLGSPAPVPLPAGIIGAHHHAELPYC